MPIKTLQLEQLAVTGRAEEPAVVADRMRLVFATLEVCFCALGASQFIYVDPGMNKSQTVF